MRGTLPLRPGARSASLLLADPPKAIYLHSLRILTPYPKDPTRPATFKRNKPRGSRHTPQISREGEERFQQIRRFSRIDHPDRAGVSEL